MCLHGNTISRALSVPNKVKLKRREEVLGVGAKTKSVKRAVDGSCSPPSEAMMLLQAADSSPSPVTF